MTKLNTANNNNNKKKTFYDQNILWPKYFYDQNVSLGNVARKRQLKKNMNVLVTVTQYVKGKMATNISITSDVNNVYDENKTNLKLWVYWVCIWMKLIHLMTLKRSCSWLGIQIIYEQRTIMN